jgi:hypothetical protein
VVLSYPAMRGSGRFCSPRAARALYVLAATALLAGLGGAPAEAQSVFADISVPTIAGNAVEGEVLQEGHATWSEPPTGYGYQWQRCNSKGEDCEGIAKARSQTYLLTAADVGFTIRVSEAAEDSAGSVTPAVSEPTAVVQVRPPEQGTGHSGTPPGSCCRGVSAGKLRSLLARQLVPAGRAASIASLLRHDGLSMSFKLPQSGSLVVRWYLASPAGKRGAKSKHKPTLVATGRASLTAAKSIRLRIALTASGRRLLAHARKIRLRAEGAFAAKGAATISVSREFTLKR